MGVRVPRQPCLPLPVQRLEPLRDRDAVGADHTAWQQHHSTSSRTTTWDREKEL